MDRKKETKLAQTVSRLPGGTLTHQFVSAQIAQSMHLCDPRSVKRMIDYALLIGMLEEVEGGIQRPGE